MSYQNYRIIVAGGRDFDDYGLLHETLSEYLNHFLDLDNSDTLEIVSGRAKGADRLGEIFAADCGYNVACFEADWRSYGKFAGLMRNVEMAKYASEEGYVGILIAFWDGESRGTKNMIDAAEIYGLDIKIVNYRKE